jgi:hypothetical protein
VIARLVRDDSPWQPTDDVDADRLILIEDR